MRPVHRVKFNTDTQTAGFLAKQPFPHDMWNRLMQLLNKSPAAICRIVRKNKNRALSRHRNLRDRRRGRVPSFGPDREAGLLSHPLQCRQVMVI